MKHARYAGVVALVPVQHVQVANRRCRTGRSRERVGSVVFSAKAIHNIIRKRRQLYVPTLNFVILYFRALAVIKHNRDFWSVTIVKWRPARKLCHFLTASMIAVTFFSTAENGAYSCSTTLTWRQSIVHFDNCRWNRDLGSIVLTTNGRCSSIACSDASSVHCFNRLKSSKHLSSKEKVVTSFRLAILSEKHVSILRSMRTSPENALTHLYLLGRAVHAAVSIAVGWAWSHLTLQGTPRCLHLILMGLVRFHLMSFFSLWEQWADVGRYVRAIPPAEFLAFLSRWLTQRPRAEENCW